jgi:hypothetical protein
MLGLMLVSALAFLADDAPATYTPDNVPKGDEVLVDTGAGEIRFNAKVQHPKDKPCIDDFGQRIQAFVGCQKAGGKPSLFADHFVFLAGTDTENVYRGLAELGLNIDVHVSRAEGREKAGKEFLKGDPVDLFVAWRKTDGQWVEERYADLVQEKVVENGKDVIRPWKPNFVFHGSGVIHKEGTGCIACPCDCPGGIIADNRTPIYDPKPTVKFDWSKAPKEGTEVVVRIKSAKKNEPTRPKATKR